MSSRGNGTEGHNGVMKNGAAERDAFERLLGVLDPDRERAAQAYETLRQKLVRFFEWRGADAPQDLADRVVDRVSRKLAEGETIREKQPSGYFYGVARNILREHWDEKKRERVALRALPREEVSEASDPVFDQRLRCLERCLEGLSAGNRELITRYYQGETRKKIENRKSLAGSLDIPLNALRIRACRLREKIEKCVVECLKRPGATK